MSTTFLQDEIKIGRDMGRRRPPRGGTHLAVFAVLLLAWSVTRQTEVAMAQSSEGFSSETSPSSAESTTTSEESTPSSGQSSSSFEESSSASVVPTATVKPPPPPNCSEGGECQNGACCKEGQCVPTSCEACPNDHQCQNQAETCCKRTKSCLSEERCKCGNCELDAGEDCKTCPNDAGCENPNCCAASGQCIWLGNDGECNCENVANPIAPVVPQGCQVQN